MEKCQPYQPHNHPGTPLPPGGLRLPPPLVKNRQWGGSGQAWQGLLNAPSSFRIIVLLKTISKILEWVMTVRLSAIARSRDLPCPNQCGSLPGLSSFDVYLALTDEVRTLQRPWLKVSTLFLDFQAGFDTVDASALRARLLASHLPSYLVDLVSSFLSQRTCTLVFEGSPNLPSPVSLGTP